MSEAKKGRTYVMSEEHKRKIGLANKGRKHTEEERRKMVLGHLRSKMEKMTTSVVQKKAGQQ